MKPSVVINDEDVIISVYYFGKLMYKEMKNIFLCGIFLGSMISTICVAQEPSVSCLNYFSEMDNNLMVTSSSVSIKTFVSNFCKIATNYKCTFDWYYFDAKQSLFLSILCSNVWKTWMYLPDNLMTWEDARLKKYKFVSFDVYNYIDESTKQKSSRNYCDYTVSDMNNCDLSYFVPHIFDSLMNDFFNIRQASNMWISSLWDSFEKEEYANTYVDNRFPWLNLQKWMKDGICKSEYYKQTCKYLKNYMWQLRNLLTTTEIIDVKKLSAANSDVDCSNDFDSNIVYCGLLWSQELPLYSLLKIVYNEYFWYNLFMSYYQYNLMIESDKLADWEETLKSSNLEKVYKSQEQVYRSKQAISQALMWLSRVEYSLPIHVWFLMYQEDLKLFMWSLPKIFTPLRTLSDKLQNVQDADS